ncbi:MAG: glycosyltransferase family 1 protein, partial [Thermoplasmatales archaeon]
KPLVGFFPVFYNLSDTARLIMIAKRYRKIGGKVIFFSHGGKYEKMARDSGFEIIGVKPIMSDSSIESVWNFHRTDSIRGFSKYRKGAKKTSASEWVVECVENELEAYKKTGIKMLVCAFILSCSISARVAKIPSISVVPLVLGESKFNIQVPDLAENTFTRLLPQSWKIHFVNWYLKRVKLFLKPYNYAAKKFNVPTFKSYFDLFLGDHTFETNDLEFINVFPNQRERPAGDYIGPILIDELFVDKFSKQETKKIEYEIEKHLKKPGRSVLLTLGSVGHENLFLKILSVLDKSNCNVIALYSQKLEEEKISNLSNKILIKKFVPSIKKIHNMVDLSITHGGQGTVYTAAYAGKPIIGIPIQPEQNLNLEKIVGHGSGIMLSKKYFDEHKLLNALNKIFDNYDEYLANAEKLANKLPPPKGPENAAKRMIEIMEEEYVR